MIPIRDSLYTRERAYVTWTIIGLNVVIFLWDRGGSLLGPNLVFADLAMRPREVVLAAQGSDGDLVELGKLFTSMFLHGNLWHIFGNVLFLSAFGPSVEVALGGHRFALYYIFWGLVASTAQIFVDPRSMNSVIGASGAIGGVLGAYFLLFPASKVRVMIPPFVWWTFSVASWLLLGVWFLAQLLVPQPGVATWAHAGGFMAGMATVLIMGGRQKVLATAPIEEDDKFDDED